MEPSSKSTLDPELHRLRRQWALLPEGDPCSIPGAVEARLAGRVLHWHPDLAVDSRVVEGRGILYLLGDAVLPAAPGADALDALASGWAQGTLEVALEAVAGTYVVVVHEGTSTRLYTDPAALMGVHYTGQSAASTPSLLPGLAEDPVVTGQYRFGGSDDWYTGSATPFRGVRVLLANHCLDLDTGERWRFWPRAEPERLGAEESVALACQLLRGMVTGAASLGPLLVSLTGGRDSRVSLAAARDLTDRCQFFTVRNPLVKACDLRAPAELAERHGLRHFFVDDPGPDPMVLELYDEISGGLAIGARREIVGACALLATEDHLHLNGNLGALTKAFFWAGDRPSEVSESVFLREFVHRPPVIREGVKEWMGTLPDFLPPHVGSTLLYLEQRGGRWMAPGENASSLFFRPFALFNSRELFNAICGGPIEHQVDARLLITYVKELWPELLDVEYCSYTRSASAFLPRWAKDWGKKLLNRK